MTTNSKSVKLIITLMRVMGLWHSSSKLERIWSNIMLSFVLLLNSFSVYVQTQELYYSSKSMTLITFVAPAATVVFTETSKLIVFIMKREKVSKLNQFVECDFWKKTYNEEEKVIINDCDAICFKSISLCLFSMLGTCTHYILIPIIGMITDSSGKREFPFPMRFETSLYESPIYEFYFILELLATLAIGLCMATFTSYLFAMNLFTAAQFDIFSMNVKSLCNFNERFNTQKDLKCQRESLQKLKKCINRHQILISLTEEIEDLYCYVMLEQVFGSIAQMCFSGVQILLVRATFQRTLLSIEFLIGSMLQFFCYCYSSHAVSEASLHVSEAIYSTHWFKITNPTIRKEFTQLMRIVAIRAHRPCILTVGKFYPLTLSAFTSVIGTSMSYFTVLRRLIDE